MEHGQQACLYDGILSNNEHLDCKHYYQSWKPGLNLQTRSTLELIIGQNSDLFAIDMFRLVKAQTRILGINNFPCGKV